jgi:hypothetical protein
MKAQSSVCMSHERIERAQYLEKRLTAIAETGPLFECECQEEARARAAQEPGT